jgi:carbon monoxide dehydrogenase subunit G
VELSHSFTVPVDFATTWAAFEDISSVAECFPGAAVTSVSEEGFAGTCKVKLGPIALQYAGQGTFLERDPDAGRLVMEAKGRDKRGNGTAGANVTATFVEVAPTETRVDVRTDLQVTGKPAQFGRGVMQDVSDKLLGQFVTCLQSKVAAPPEAAAPSEAAPASAPGEGTAAVAEPAGAPPPVEVPAADDAVNLVSTVLPVLLRLAWKPALGALVAAALLRWVWRRRH